MTPEPMPNPEPLREPKRKALKAPPLDIYVASVMERIPATALSSTYLGEFLMQEAIGDLPENVRETQVANIFWSAVFDVSKTESEKGEDREAHTLPFLVCYKHEGPPRFDLVAFSKRFTGPSVRYFETFVLQRPAMFRGALKRIAQAWWKAGLETTDRLSPEEKKVRSGLHAIDELPEKYVEEFAQDFAKKMHPCEVILPAPELQPHAELRPCALVPGPPVGVATDARAIGTSSVGIVARNKSGQVGVTMAGHAIPLIDGKDYKGIPIWIAGEEGYIVTSHMNSDSVFVHHPRATTFPAKPLVSRLETVAPGLNEPMRFSGLATLGGTTRLVGAPLTLPLKDLGIQKYFFTELSTLPSDSGCACFDSRDNLAGFCWGGSGTSSASAFSLWMWADSVWKAHKLA